VVVVGCVWGGGGVCVCGWVCVWGLCVCVLCVNVSSIECTMHTQLFYGHYADHPVLAHTPSSWWNCTN